MDSAENSPLGTHPIIDHSGVTNCPPVDGPPAFPYPLSSPDELVGFGSFQEPSSVGKNCSCPKFSDNWKVWVEKLAPTFSKHWDRLLIKDFIDLTLQSNSFSQEMVIAALAMWSPHCNSFIFPGGPMSVTLRDICALTHLPILGPEVPCLVESEAFPSFKPIELGTKSYSAYINHFSQIKELAADPTSEHIHFLWVLICKYIFFPSSGHPTMDYLVIAKYLAEEEPLALGKMLLGSLFHNLYLNLSKQPFSRLNGGCLWLLQLWLFSYFPSLREGNPSSPGFAGMRVASCRCSLSFQESLDFFHGLQMKHSDYFIFHDDPIDLPVSTRSYSLSSIDSSGPWFWKSFLNPSFLHVGVGSKDKKLGTGLFPCLEGYHPSLWSRQFGLAQCITAIPLERFPQGNLRTKLSYEQVQRMYQKAKMEALELTDLIYTLPSIEAAQLEFENHWQSFFPRYFEHVPKGKETENTSKISPLPVKRKKEVKLTARKKAKEVSSSKKPIRKSQRVTAQNNKSKPKVLEPVLVDDSDIEEPISTEMNSASDDELDTGNAEPLLGIVARKEDSLISEPALKGFKSGYLASQETDPSENSSSSSFLVKVKSGESPFLSYRGRPFPTPPSQDSTTQLVARPALSSTSDLLSDLDLSFLPKRSVSSSFLGGTPSQESISFAKETVKKYFGMELGELDHLKLRSLQSALNVLAAAACNQPETHSLLKSMASEIPHHHDQLSADIDNYFSLKKKLSGFMSLVDALHVKGEEADARASIDVLKKEEYEAEQRVIQQLETQLAQSLSKLEQLDCERAELASQQAKDIETIMVIKSKVKDQQGEVNEWLGQKEEIIARRAQIKQAWDNYRALDLNSIPALPSSLDERHQTDGGSSSAAAPGK